MKTGEQTGEQLADIELKTKHSCGFAAVFREVSHDPEPVEKPLGMAT